MNARLTKPMRTALDSAELCWSGEEIKLGRKWLPTTVQRVTCSPQTARALRARGLVGPVVRSFAVPEQAPHGQWFNRQRVQVDLLQGPVKP